ncbi:MAG: hypothetical protein AAF617_01465 [Bacteroidota bacterium]
MELFTFIFEFLGGTYIYQSEASDMNEALHKWVENLTNDLHEIKYLGPKTIQEIQEILFNDSTEDPTPISNIKNVWCVTLYTKKGAGLLNIIKTEAS